MSASNGILVATVQCAKANCGFVRYIWSWDDDERDRVWEWLKTHNKSRHNATTVGIQPLPPWPEPTVELGPGHTSESTT